MALVLFDLEIGKLVDREVSAKAMIVFLTKDLMIQGQANAAARRTGAMVKAVGNVDTVIQELENEANALLLVDLQTPGLDVDYLIERLSAMVLAPRAIAYAQHVYEDLLQQAQSDAFETVLTRGQFTRDLPEIIAGHMA